LKANLNDENDPVDDDDPDNPSSNTPLLAKLNDMVIALRAACPGLSPEQAIHFLLFSPRGRRLAEHLNTLKRNEEPPTIDITKLHNIASVIEIAKQINTDGNASGISEHQFTSIVQGHAKLAKRANESDVAAFARIFTDPANVELRKAHALTKSPNMMSVTPTSVETGSTLVTDDSAEAVRLLNEMAEKQHRTFEQVFADPANGELAGRTYTSAHRPNVSSTSGSELQRR
jgi:hypothetical protein